MIIHDGKLQEILLSERIKRLGIDFEFLKMSEEDKIKLEEMQKEAISSESDKEILKQIDEINQDQIDELVQI